MLAGGTITVSLFHSLLLSTVLSILRALSLERTVALGAEWQLLLMLSELRFVE
jgi:hypothetical protein